MKTMISKKERELNYISNYKVENKMVENQAKEEIQMILILNLEHQIPIVQNPTKCLNNNH